MIKTKVKKQTLFIELLHDEIEAGIAASLLDSIKSEIERSEFNVVVMDLGNVKHLDSSAVGMIVVINKFLKESNKSLKLMNINDKVNDILNLIGYPMMD